MDHFLQTNLSDPDREIELGPSEPFRTSLLPLWISTPERPLGRKSRRRWLQPEPALLWDPVEYPIRCTNTAQSSSGPFGDPVSDLVQGNGSRPVEADRGCLDSLGSEFNQAGAVQIYLTQCGWEDLLSFQKDDRLPPK